MSIFGELANEIEFDKYENELKLWTIGICNTQIIDGATSTSVGIFPKSVYLLFNIDKTEYLGRGGYIDIDDVKHEFCDLIFDNYRLVIQNFRKIRLIQGGVEKSYEALSQTIRDTEIELWYELS